MHNVVCLTALPLASSLADTKPGKIPHVSHVEIRYMFASLRCSCSVSFWDKLYPLYQDKRKVCLKDRYGWIFMGLIARRVALSY